MALKFSLLGGFVMLTGALLSNAQAFDGSGAGGSGNNVSIRTRASDMMVLLASAWAQTYKSIRPNVTVHVDGNGPGIGFAGLANGHWDLVFSQRAIKQAERDFIEAGGSSR